VHRAVDVELADVEAVVQIQPQVALAHRFELEVAHHREEAAGRHVVARARLRVDDAAVAPPEAQLHVTDDVGRRPGQLDVEDQAELALQRRVVGDERADLVEVELLDLVDGGHALARAAAVVEADRLRQAALAAEQPLVL
jgi:hypothetical protein